MTIEYSQDRHHDISWVWNSMSPWIILNICDHKNHNHSISLSRIWNILIKKYDISVVYIIGRFETQGL